MEIGKWDRGRADLGGTTQPLGELDGIWREESDGRVLLRGKETAWLSESVKMVDFGVKTLNPGMLGEEECLGRAGKAGSISKSSGNVIPRKNKTAAREPGRCRDLAAFPSPRNCH